MNILADLPFEAKLIGFKEGLKAAIVWLVIYSYLLGRGRERLINAFYAGIILSYLTVIACLFSVRTLPSPETAGNFISMSFALFLILSGALLYHSSGVNIFFGRDHIGDRFAWVIIFSFSIAFFVPDTAGILIFLDQLAIMRGSPYTTYINALSGFVIAIVIIIAAVRLYRPYGIGSFFDLPQIFLFVAMVKLFGSGIKGVTELSLIPSVQKGFMKFIHDVVHQTFIMLLVPDHPLLKQTTWNFIGVFFGPAFASSASLVILLVLPIKFIYQSLILPPREPVETTSGVMRRKLLSVILSERRKKAIPVIIFTLIIIAGWISGSSEQISRMYIPTARPVVADAGVISIPIKDATTDLMDGNLHKFSLSYNGEEIRFMVIKKSDDTLAVSLDACEICPPDGYGLRAGHVICIYCGTPIPVDSLGNPGGCNPVPLVFDTDGKLLRIQLDEIVKKWGFVRLKDENS
jgi:hypothetical protein